MQPEGNTHSRLKSIQVTHVIRINISEDLVHLWWRWRASVKIVSENEITFGFEYPCYFESNRLLRGSDVDIPVTFFKVQDGPTCFVPFTHTTHQTARDIYKHF